MKSVANNLLLILVKPWKYVNDLPSSHLDQIQGYSHSDLSLSLLLSLLHWCTSLCGRENDGVTADVWGLVYNPRYSSLSHMWTLPLSCTLRHTTHDSQKKKRKETRDLVDSFNSLNCKLLENWVIKNSNQICLMNEWMCKHILTVTFWSEEGKRTLQ